MMTKKRIILMIIMIVVLIAVAAALVLLLSKTPAQQEAQSSLIVVAETDTADVVGLDFASGGDVTSLVKNDGLWYYSGNISGTVDQLLTESTVTYLSYMYADSIARQSVDDLSPYGLDPAALTVTLTLKNSETLTYKFGVSTSDKTGVYFQLDGDPRLYVFDMANYTQVAAGISNLNDLALDIDAKTLTDIVLMRSEGERAEMHFALIPEDKRIGTETWMLESPFKAVANPEAVQLVEVLFSPARLAGYVSDTVKPEHGISESSPYLAMTDSSGKTVELTFGSRTEEDTYYCTVSGRDGVYTAYAGMDQLLGMDTFDAIAPTVFPVSAAKLPAFTLTVGNTVYDLEDNLGAYSLNGRALTPQQAADLAAFMGSIRIEGESLDASTEELAAVFEMGDITIGLSVYRNDYLAASINGTPYAYTKMENLALLVQMLDEYLVA